MTLGLRLRLRNRPRPATTVTCGTNCESSGARGLQAPTSVVIVRPHHFAPNPQTAGDNAFQTVDRARTPVAIATAAHEEVTRLANGLSAAGVRVHIFEDERTDTPDSVFPNNWFSTHCNGQVAIYPMYAENRRRERRTDVIEMLKTEYQVREVIDYSGLEQDGVVIEGTGALVLDHMCRVAYAIRSNRMDERALRRFCDQFDFEPVPFDAADDRGRPVYHTNVLMCIGTDFVLLGTSMIRDAAQRSSICRRVLQSGRRLIELSADQIASFAGNAIELEGASGRVVAISSRALRALHRDQILAIEDSAQLLPCEVPTIELAGGSVRCMLAGIHLIPRRITHEVS